MALSNSEQDVRDAFKDLTLKERRAILKILGLINENGEVNIE